MRCINVFPGLVASVLLVNGTIAGPCKPKTTFQSSEALVSSTTASSPFAPASTVDVTSNMVETVSTSTVLVGVTSTEATTSVDTTATAETTADTTTLATLTTEATTDTNTLFTETSAIESTTTSGAHPPLTYFYLIAANSDHPSANGNYVLLSPSNAMSLGPLPNPGSETRIGYFSIEPVTNYLKMDDLYVVAPNLAFHPIALSTSNFQSSYIVCTPPLAIGDKLSCDAMGSSWKRWAVDMAKAIYLRSNTVTTSYRFMDLIVS